MQISLDYVQRREWLKDSFIGPLCEKIIIHIGTTIFIQHLTTMDSIGIIIVSLMGIKSNPALASPINTHQAAV